jgi:hypothetical protein
LAITRSPTKGFITRVSLGKTLHIPEQGAPSARQAEDTLLDALTDIPMYSPSDAARHDRWLTVAEGES